MAVVAVASRSRAAPRPGAGEAAMEAPRNRCAQTAAVVHAELRRARGEPGRGEAVPSAPGTWHPPKERQRAVTRAAVRPSPTANTWWTRSSAFRAEAKQGRQSTANNTSTWAQGEPKRGQARVPLLGRLAAVSPEAPQKSRSGAPGSLPDSAIRRPPAPASRVLEIDPGFWHLHVLPLSCGSRRRATARGASTDAPGPRPGEPQPTGVAAGMPKRAAPPEARRLP